MINFHFKDKDNFYHIIGNELWIQIMRTQMRPDRFLRHYVGRYYLKEYAQKK